MHLLFPLLNDFDPEVYQFLKQSQVQSYFALSWILTWFSHNLHHFGQVAHLFDFLLASHPLMPLYITATIIHQHRDQLLHLECELTVIHGYFQQFHAIDLPQVIAFSIELIQRVPPRVLVSRFQPSLPTDSPLYSRSMAELYREKEWYHPFQPQVVTWSLRWNDFLLDLERHSWMSLMGSVLCGWIVVGGLIDWWL